MEKFKKLKISQYKDYCVISALIKTKEYGFFWNKNKLIWQTLTKKFIPVTWLNVLEQDCSYDNIEKAKEAIENYKKYPIEHYINL